MASESEKIQAVETLDDRSGHDNTTNSMDAPGEEGEGVVTFKIKMAVGSLILMYECYLFTLIMPPVVLAYINADLGPDPRYPWIAITWNLVAAIIIAVGGRLADIFGRRWFLLVGAAVSAVGALVGATGQSINQMIASGILFGFGGGFQEMCFACAQELVPKKYRFRTLGFMYIANIVSSLSPLIAYVFITFSPITWRAIYWWCFAFECLCIVMLFIFYHPPTFQTKHSEDRATRFQLLKELDYVGVVLFSGACLILLLALNWGGGAHPWKSSWVISPIVVSGVTFIVLGFWEAYAPLKYPILPPKLFANWRGFTGFLVVCFVAGMLYYSMNVIWPRQSALLWIPATDNIIRGVYANMISFGTLLAGVYCIAVMPWAKHERVQLIAAITIQTALVGSLASVGISGKGQAIATVILVGTVNVLPSPLSFGMVSLHLENQSDIGVAVGLMSTFRLIGGAIATAVYTSIQSSHFAAVFPGNVEAAAEATGFKGNMTMLLHAAANNTLPAYHLVPGLSNATISAVTTAVKVSNSQGYRVVYLVAIAFGCCAITSALSVKGISDSQRTQEISAHLEHDTQQLTEKKENV